MPSILYSIFYSDFRIQNSEFIFHSAARPFCTLLSFYSFLKMCQIL